MFVRHWTHVFAGPQWGVGAEHCESIVHAAPPSAPLSPDPLDPDPEEEDPEDDPPPVPDEEELLPPEVEEEADEPPLEPPELLELEDDVLPESLVAPLEEDVVASPTPEPEPLPLDELPPVEDVEEATAPSPPSGNARLPVVVDPPQAATSDRPTDTDMTTRAGSDIRPLVERIGRSQSG
jgi:protein TonB